MWRNPHLDSLAQFLGTRPLNRTVHYSRKRDDESGVIIQIINELNRLGIDNGKRPRFLKS